MSKTVSKATLEKRRQTLKKALICFTEHGVEGSTVEMIREASGMSVGSLYHHFGNKEKIAAAVFIQGMREFGGLTKAYLEQIPEESRSAEQGVKALVYAQIDWISSNPDWARFVFQHRSFVTKAKADEKLKQDKDNFALGLINWFVPYIEKGALLPLPIEIFSSLISGPTHDYARHWLAGRYKTPLIKHREIFASSAWQAVKSG